MKHSAILLSILLSVSLPTIGKVAHILPKPHIVRMHSTATPFLLHRKVSLNDPTGNKALRAFLNSSGCKISGKAAAVVSVQLVDSIQGSHDYILEGFPNETYRLDVSADTIAIKAVSDTGVTRAAQTLAQMAAETAALEAVSITDWPAFKLRGWMQDVGRSFLSVDELKREIDMLAQFKVNVFHWHLTENLAWRFQVRAFPQLTAKENMARFPGMYYTQKQCREIESYAHERGVTVIPEIDMPGHSKVFTHAMGFDMQSDMGRKALKTILSEVAETFSEAPYLHIGGDEVTLKSGFLKEMASFVRNRLGRKVVVWNPLVNENVTSDIADMSQMWSTRGKAVAGMPNIDCRYNYTNHFDVYADLAGIYLSNIYYEAHGSPEIAGTISAAWNDTLLPTQDDIVRQNNQYANIIASAERAWIGGGKEYIEQRGTTLPESGDEYNEFCDFERRFLFHKDHSLPYKQIAYVRQSNVHWRISEPFPNNGDASAVFPPETVTDSVMPHSFMWKGKRYNSATATGAGIYLRHIWHPIVPSFFANPKDSITAYAWTYVYSPLEQDAAAQIEFYTYSRSGDEYAPRRDSWDRRGSRIWLNGKEIVPPKWRQTDCAIPQDNPTHGLENENLTARRPTPVHLQKGWNKVILKLPHANSGGTRRDKWQFTFVITDRKGRKALDGLVYSPDK